jgi:spore germination protein GerM
MRSVLVRARSLRASVVSVVLIVLALGGCGIPPDGEPRPLAADDVPYGLLDEVPVGGAPPTTAAPAARVNVTVYFLAGERLQGAPRSVAEPATPSRAIVALLGGPTEEEAAAGLRTAVNPATEAVVTRPAAELVSVDLSASFAAVPTQEQRFALAQIVFTATGVSGVGGVRFTLAGAPVEVPLPDGTVTAAPVGRAAFASLVPQPPGDPQPA